MAILRRARELAAAKLGAELEAVGPETELGDESRALLAALLGAVEQQLAEEQGIELAPASAGDAVKRLEALGLDVTSSSPTTVAAAAEVVTRAAVRLLVANRLDVPAAELSEELSFAVDLGADSLTRVDLVLLLEEALDVSVPDDSMAMVQTVGDSELFSVLYDRTREALEQALGMAAGELSYNAPLEARGDDDGSIALEAASRAAGIDLPERPCPTLQEAVRLAFLARRLQEALARVCEVSPAAIVADTVPGEDLGLSDDQTLAALRKLAATMELSLPKTVGAEDLRSFSAALLALSGPPCGAPGPVR